MCLFSYFLLFRRLHVVVVVDVGPRGQDVVLDAALVAAAQDAEVAALAPPRSPGVGRDLEGRGY